MISSFSNFHDKVWADIESRFIPGEPKYAIVLLAEIPFGIALSCIQAVNKILSFIASFFVSNQLPDPKEHFSSVLQDPRQWEKLGDIESQITLGHGNPNFQFGTATCTYQDSGKKRCPDSQWAPWEEKKVPEANQSGQSGNFFELYKTKEGRDQITNALEKLGVNSYRFSIEWSHIEPKEGQWNEVNLQVYINLCKHLRDRGIMPMITLHHFSEPNDFHLKGSFENEENIERFIRFAEKVIPPLTASYKGKPLVEHFCTINEPAIEAFCRFIRGQPFLLELCLISNGQPFS